MNEEVHNASAKVELPSFCSPILRRTMTISSCGLASWLPDDLILASNMVSGVKKTNFPCGPGFPVLFKSTFHL